jgi:hypothetical protein
MSTQETKVICMVRPQILGTSVLYCGFSLASSAMRDVR